MRTWTFFLYRIHQSFTFVSQHRGHFILRKMLSLMQAEWPMCCCLQFSTDTRSVSLKTSLQMGHFTVKYDEVDDDVANDDWSIRLFSVIAVVSSCRSVHCSLRT